MTEANKPTELTWQRLAAMHLVFHDVVDERERQDRKHGGPEHDDKHTASAFVAFVTDHASDAEDAANRGTDGDYGDEYRAEMIKVAALAFAAVESYDRFRADHPLHKRKSRR